MKTATQELTGITAEFDAAVSFQNKPLTIAGPAELIQDLHAQAETHTARVNRLMPKVAQVAVQVEKSQPEVLEGRRATIHAKLWDLTHNSNMYELLQQKRRDEANLAMATRLGLISLEDVSCRKHEKAIAKLHNL